MTGEERPSRFAPLDNRLLYFVVLAILGLLVALLVAPGWAQGVRAADCSKSSNYLAVWEIQGSGHTSPYDGERVSNVRGVVTADFQQGTGGPWELWGFFIQAHETDCDSATSDGVFVYTGSTPKDVQVGDLVEIDRADVDEFQGPDSFIWELTLTELVCRSGCNVSLLQSGHALPPVEDYNPPENETDSLAYNESREGMLMEVAVDSTVVAAANQYNELVMLRGTGLDRLHRDDPPHGHKIMVNGDGIASANCGQEGLGYIKTFDTLHYDPANGFAAYGPLNYGFNNYKVQQADDQFCLSWMAGDDSSYDPADNPAPSADANVLTAASFNAWNFFDTSDDPDKNDETDITQAEYDQHSLKLADAVCNPDGLNQPLILGLQEVENETVLQKLVGDINTACGASYDYHTLAGPDDRSIEVSYLTRSDRVTVVAVNDRQGCSSTDWGVDYESGDHQPDVTCDGSTPYYLHNRVPLHLEAQIDLAGSTRTIHVINNHFKSKLSNSACSQSDCTDWRIEEAQHVDSLVDNLLASDPGAYVVVMGDLNDFYNSAPLDELDKTNGVLTNVWVDLTGPPSSGQGTITRYSYIFNGVSQTLDHALISDAFDALARTTAPRHISADWPGTHLDDNTMFRASDHDALLVGFDFSTGGDSAPSAAIVNPSDGATVSGTVTIQVDASDTEDDTGTLTVEVSIDGGAWQSATYNSTSGYYELSWDTTGVADGSHTIDARATDSAGNTTNAAQISVTVDNVDDPPSAAIVNPSDGETVSGAVTIQVDASDDRDDTGTLAVEVAIDGGTWQSATYNSTSGYYELSWDTTGVADGSHTIDARATDSAGNTTNANQITVTVNNADEPPSASIVNPLDGETVSGTVTIQVDASDTEDDTGTLTVEVAIDGGTWQTATYNSTSGYYELSWDTIGVADGSHTIDARATDSAGNTTNAAQITVTVDNSTSASMHVESIDFDLQANHGKNLTYDVTGLVTVYDEAGNPVAGAEVDIQWSGAASGTETITTDSTGVAATTPVTVNNNEQVCLEVTDVRHTDYTYDSTQNVETKDCITP